MRSADKVGDVASCLKYYDSMQTAPPLDLQIYAGGQGGVARMTIHGLAVAMALDGWNSELEVTTLGYTAERPGVGVCVIWALYGG